MDSDKIRIIGAIVILLLCSQSSIYSDNEGDSTADVSDPNGKHAVGISIPAEKEQSESDIIEYFAKKKIEILDGRKFNDQTTPANALLTLISAYHHQDKNTLDQIFPIVKQKQFEKLSSPEVRAQMLAAARTSILCRIEIENKQPEESDLCAIYTRPSPEKPIDQVWSFAYIGGAWRFAGSTSSMDNWRTQAVQAEAMTRNILQSEAAKTKAAATNTIQKKANTVEGKWQATLTEFNQKYVMRFWRKPDGSLAGAATRKSPDDRPFDTVTFENGKLRFEEKVNQCVFEGTMKEDGLTIEGKLQKPDLITPCVLERIEAVEIEDKDQGISKQVQGAPKPDESTISRVLSLDGKTGCMRVADSQSLSSFSDAITMEVWLKASSFCTESGDINSIIRKNVVPGAENFLFRFRNINGAPMLDMGFGSEIGGLQVSHEFTMGTWYHLAGTYDGSSITIFINGLAIDSKSVSGRLHIDQSDLYVGKGDPTFSSGEYFHGVLDEIRIWNVAHSQEQIQAAINSPLTGNQEGLIGYWNFDDGTAKDLSGHNNDGILNGDAQIIESPRPATLVFEERESNKLVAWWKFENDANDSAGASNGIIQGNPTYVDGKVGRAISLDGDDYVDFGNPDSLNFGTDNWTISAWIKTTQTGTEPENRGTIFANGGDEAGGIRYALAVNEEYLGTVVLTTDSDIQKVQVVGKTAVNDNAWHHVVGTRNAGQLYIYVDGELDGGDYVPDGYDLSGSSQHNAYIGVITDNRDGSLYKYFVGLIDEVCVIRGAIDAKGVRALYSGGDPATVAQTAVDEPHARPQPVMAVGARGDIEGDWQLSTNPAIIQIRRKSDGSLEATAVAESPDTASPPIPLDDVTFENGTLRFKATSQQAVFEGTMNENGMTIEGQFQQQGQIISALLKRIVAVPSEAVPVVQEQLQDSTSGKSNIVVALILILVLAGVVAGIVYFLVKSSIR